MCPSPTLPTTYASVHSVRAPCRVTPVPETPGGPAHVKFVGPIGVRRASVRVVNRKEFEAGDEVGPSGSQPRLRVGTTLTHEGQNINPFDLVGVVFHLKLSGAGPTKSRRPDSNPENTTLRVWTQDCHQGRTERHWTWSHTVDI